jgi:hypothetical protein
MELANQKQNLLRVLRYLKVSAVRDIVDTNTSKNLLDMLDVIIGQIKSKFSHMEKVIETINKYRIRS